MNDFKEFEVKNVQCLSDILEQVNTIIQFNGYKDIILYYKDKKYKLNKNKIVEFLLENKLTVEVENEN